MKRPAEHPAPVFLYHHSASTVQTTSCGLSLELHLPYSSCHKMRTAALLLLLGLAGSAMAARTLQAEEYPILDEFEPLYNVLNITGWEDYPEGCWLFPLPSINVVIDGEVFLLSAQAGGSSDKTNGKTVATAWCEYNGFDGVGEMKLQDFSESQIVRTVDIVTGKTCEGVGAPNGAGAPCTALKYVECFKGKATSGCSRRFAYNNGVDNMGYGNAVGTVSGSTNVGNFNNGSTNLGDWNDGSANVGSFNIGSANYGNCFQGVSASKGFFGECPPYAVIN